jgi:ABC-type Mn2+/Zn2+ transport system ATPase subunit
MSGPIIDIRDAVVAYREDVALRGVSLRVDRGAFVGVIGPNGAGKTTILTLINGMGRLLRGSVRVLGSNPFGLGGWRLRRRVGYVAQTDRIDPRHPMRVRDTVMAGRMGFAMKPPSRDDRIKVDQALDEVGAAHLSDRPLGHLSGGEYQRVAIARALVQEPEIFLFDEPAAAIDPRAQKQILELVQRIHAESGAATLYVTHDLETLPEACDRLVLMKNGRVWREGQRDSLLLPAVLNALYGEEPAASAPVAARA